MNNPGYQTRRHKNAPFGVVASQMKIDIERDGAITESLEMTLAISDTGKTATSDLPDHH